MAAIETDPDKAGFIQIAPLIDLDTPLGDVPEYWLRFVEPFIVRGKWLGSCWGWRGYRRDDRPCVHIPVHLGTDERWGKGTKWQFAHRFAAAMFWKIPDGWVVRRTCDTADCMNPNHFDINYKNAVIG